MVGFVKFFFFFWERQRDEKLGSIERWSNEKDDSADLKMLLCLKQSIVVVVIVKFVVVVVVVVVVQGETVV